MKIPVESWKKRSNSQQLFTNSKLLKSAAAENGAQEKSRENRAGKITRTATSASAACTAPRAAAAHSAQLIALSFHEKIRWLTGAETAAAALHSDPFGVILSKKYMAFSPSQSVKFD